MALVAQPQRKMFNYMNNPANPSVFNNSEVSKKGLIPKEPTYVPYDTVDDMGTGIVDRMLKQTENTRELASRGSSFVSGISDSVLANLINKALRPNFDEDINFQASDYLSELDRQGDIVLNAEEKKHVRDAKSAEEADYLLQEVRNFRTRQAEVSDHPVYGAIGAIFGDAPSFIIPSVAAARTSTSVANAIRITMGAYDIASAYSTRNELGQSILNTYLVGGAAILDGLLLVRAARNAKNIKLQKAASVGGETPPSSAEVRVDPDQPIIKKDITSMADIESDIANAETIQAYKDVAVQNATRRGYNIEELDIPIGRKYQKLTKTELKNINSFAQLDKLSKTDSVSAGAVLAKAAQASKGTPETPFLMDILDSVGSALPENAKLRFAMNSDIRAYTKVQGDAIEVVLPLPKGAREARTVSQALERMSSDELKTLLHEGIHAATVGVIKSVRRGTAGLQQTQAVGRLDNLLRHIRTNYNSLSQAQRKALGNLEEIKYYLGSTEEFVAGLVNSKDLQKFLMQVPTIRGKESVLRSAIKMIMQALGIMPKQTAFSDAVDGLHDLLTGTDTMIRATSVPNFVSSTMKPVAEEAAKFYGEAPKNPVNKVQASARGLMEGAKKTFKKNFLLYGQIEQGSPELARVLVANPLSNNKAEAAVADYVRRNQTVANVATAEVETAIYKAAKAEYGINATDQFFNRKKYIKAIKELETDTFNYLQTAYKNDIRGIEVTPPPKHIQSIVKAYTDSGWAETWLKEMRESKMLSSEGTSIEIQESKYYHPVSYSGDRIKAGIRNGMFSSKNVINLMGKSISDTMPTLEPKFKDKLVEKWYRNITEGAPRVQGLWRVKAQEGIADDVADILAARGLPDDFIDTIIADKELMDSIRPTIKEKNLRARADFDYTKQWDVGEGKMMSLSDIQDANVTKNMMRYNARMAGRTAFSRAGYQNMSQLEKVVKDAERALPAGVDERQWRKYVDDTIDTLLGYQVGSNEIPDLLRSAGYLSNAMVLKNSGIYGMSDLYLGLIEFGFAKTLRAMAKGGMWKEFTKTLGEDSELARRFQTIANHAMKDDMRYRLIQTYAEDLADITQKSQFLAVTKNMASTVQGVNGLRAVQYGMANLYSGLIWDEFKDLMTSTTVKFSKEGAPEITGGTLKSWQNFSEAGLTSKDLQRMRQHYTKNPTKRFPDDLEVKFEVAAQRRTDRLLQQSRLGETSHFVALNPIGRLIVGYQAFAMTATTNVLGRAISNGDYKGLALMFIYQAPLMMMAIYAKSVLDGKASKLTSEELIMNALQNMGMLGVVANTLDIFTNRDPKSEIAMLASVNAFRKALADIAAGAMPDLGRLIPYAQTAVPLRAVINNINNISTGD